MLGICLFSCDWLIVTFLPFIFLEGPEVTNGIGIPVTPEYTDAVLASLTSAKKN